MWVHRKPKNGHINKRWNYLICNVNLERNSTMAVDFFTYNKYLISNSKLLFVFLKFLLQLTNYQEPSKND
jgi:hypothetical protein